MIRYKKDLDNIVTLTLDMSDKSINIINYEIGRTFVPVIKHLKEEKAKGQLRGVIIASAKKSFLAGGDIDFLYESTDAQKIFDFSLVLNTFLRDLESPGVPVVAAMNGSALGSGFELAMACHHRIVINNPKTQLGYPEVELGLMPGSGGIIRLMWLLGIERAFPILASGYRYSPKEALEAGIVDALAVDEEDMLEQAREWLLETREGRRKWDKVDGSIPGGTANDLDVAQKIRQMAAELSKRTYNNFEAPQAILNTLAEGSKVDFDTACRIESRYFTQLMLNKQSKNMMKVFWYDQHEVKAGLSRPKGYGKFRPRKIGIIGAGVMGSAIAYSCASNGLQVVIKDVSKPTAEQGKIYAEQRFSDLVRRNIITKQEKDSAMNLIKTTDSSRDFSDCDLVIEAVFESLMVKSKALKDAGEHLDQYSIVASNTSSIPISELGKTYKMPENFVGIHFFPPADESQLVEIVKGKNTSEETIARAFDFAKLIRKIPIVVQDNPGFYVARTHNTYILEAVTMLQEGYCPAIIENIGYQSGMPKGGLALADDLSLNLILEFERQAAAHYGARYVQHPAVQVIRKMTDELQRTGRNRKMGFYEYNNDTPQLWHGLTAYFPTTKTTYEVEIIKERFIFAQCVEAIWCLQEKIVATEAEANLGSVYGWGFPSHYGGVLQYIRAYGNQKFVARCEEFVQKYGGRFRLPKGWKEKLMKKE
jgi:3-hydroxyacyl-CoA dehydrogenase / enoyl-CoA hydratase / 3-hydroxybutyryl-CoA epimerase